MDRCTGGAVLHLRAALKSLEHSYLRIEVAREATLALLLTPAAPEALSAFRSAAKIEKKIEEAIRKDWEWEAKRWESMTGLGCRLRRMPERSPYPPFQYPIINPDLSILEMRTSRFLLSQKRPIELSIHSAQLRSGARLEQVNHEWLTYWYQ
jgi:hypothetical protein